SGRIKFQYATKRPEDIPRDSSTISAQCNFIQGQQRRKMLAREKRIFAFALGRQRVEADQDVVDESGMTHHETALRQLLEKPAHQRAEIRFLRKIIGAGESGIERDAGAGGTLAKLRAQYIEDQRLGRAKPLRQRQLASALAHPGAGRGLFD